MASFISWSIPCGWGSGARISRRRTRAPKARTPPWASPGSEVSAIGPPELDHGEILAGAGVVDRASGHHIPPGIHRHGPGIIMGISGAVEDIAPELGAAGPPQLDHGEILAGAGVVDR